MAIIATNEGTSTYEPIKAGSYAARCVSMIHYGTIEELYQGTPKRTNKVRVTWELPTVKREFKEGEGEKPCVIAKEFTLSMHEKANLRSFLTSWRGSSFTEQEAQAFDITVLLGIPCLLSVINKTSQKGKVYDDISAVSMLPEGMTCPDQVNESVEFSVLDFDVDKFNALPEFIQNKIKGSEEFAALNIQVTEPTPEQPTTQPTTQPEQVTEAANKPLF